MRTWHKGWALGLGLWLLAAPAGLLAQQEAPPEEQQTDDLTELFAEEPPGGQEQSQPAGEGAAPQEGGTDDLTELFAEEPAGEGAVEGEAGSLEDVLSEGGLEAAPAAGGGQAPPAEEERALSLSFNGYVKPLASWETIRYPEEFKAAGVKDKERFSTVGVRSQVWLQGALRNRAEFFSAVNLTFNEVAQDEDFTANEGSHTGDLRMVESYVDLFGESSRWRVGSQLVTWGFADGFEVPTDRLNARDLAFDSSELEDLKLASTGVQWRWTVSRAYRQRLSLFYIPVGKVDRLPRDFEAFFNQAESESPEADSSNSKYALRYTGTLGLMDYALSYVTGINRWPDLKRTADPNSPLAKTYHRVSSPGLDLQFDFGGFLGRVSGVYYDTDDANNSDPLVQNDWYQYMVGAEFWIGTALAQINAGQKIVRDYDDSEAARTNNILLNQFAETTNIVVGSFTDSYLTGNALELSLLYGYLWEPSGEVVGIRVRPSFSYNLGDGLTLTFLPAYIESIGIKTYDLYGELKFSF